MMMMTMMMNVAVDPGTPTVYTESLLSMKITVCIVIKRSGKYSADLPGVYN